jgi:hypothetical protein
MCFDFDIKYLIYPMWYHALYSRGESYIPLFMRYMLALYKWLASEEGVRTRIKSKIGVIFFGHDRREFYKSADKICYDELVGLEKEISKLDVHPQRWLILGVLTKPHGEIMIEETVRLARKTKETVDRRCLVNSYYGMHIDDVQVYIAFDTFTTESYPPFIMTDKENLYFTKAPHPYINKDVLKDIFEDYLIKKVNQNPPGYDLDSKDLKKMNRFYKNNARCVSGVGVEHKKKYTLWFPQY